MASQDARAAAVSGGQNARVGPSASESFAVSASAPQPKASASTIASMSSGKRPASGGPGLPQRSAEELRRNGLNMERMIKKNVLAASRPGGMKRGLAVVEYFKNKKSKEQQQDAGSAATSNGSGNAEDADERSAKRRRMLVGAETPAPSDTAVGAASTPGAASRSAMSPARRSNPGAINAGESLAALMASPQRPQHYRGNPLHLVSPGRARAAVAINVSSPSRPPRAAHGMTSPIRAIRNGTMASPMRRPGQFLTSPMRPHRTAASPRKPLFQDEEEASSASNTAATPAASGNAIPASTRPQRLSASAPMLESALDQIERSAALARPSTTTSASSSKSPFHSFQSKFAQKPRQGPLVLLSPTTEASAAQSEARNGPSVMDLSSPRTSEQAVVSTETTRREQVQQQPAREVKPARSLFAKRSAIANRSMCFSTERVASSLDVSPDGEIVVVGFTDGSVRLYEMDSNVPSDRHGYLLGHIDEESNQGTGNVNLRVKITPDGRYIFVGCRTGPRVVMSINLDHYRNEKGTKRQLQCWVVELRLDSSRYSSWLMLDRRRRGRLRAVSKVVPVGHQSPGTFDRCLGVGNTAHLSNPPIRLPPGFCGCDQRHYSRWSQGS
jgi:hypothetical protein